MSFEHEVKDSAEFTINRLTRNFEEPAPTALMRQGAIGTGSGEECNCRRSIVYGFAEAASRTAEIDNELVNASRIARREVLLCMFGTE